MFTSRQRLFAKLNQLEKKRVSNQQSVNQYKHELFVKIYDYQTCMLHLILPAFLCGWTLARIRGTYFKSFVRYMSRFVLLSIFDQAKNWMRQVIASDKR